MKGTKKIISLLLAATIVSGSWGMLGGSYALADEGSGSTTEETTTESPPETTTPPPSTPTTTPPAPSNPDNNNNSTDNNADTENTGEEGKTPGETGTGSENGDEPADPSTGNTPEDQDPDTDTPEDNTSNEPEETQTIELEKTSLTLTAGDTYTMTATVSPAGTAYTWKTSDKTVADVDQNGVITGVKAGTATITAQINDSIRASCVVTVTAPEETKTITLEKTSLMLYVDGTYTMAATVSPAGTAYTWNTSDKAVATVDKNGVITGVKAGKATITAKIDDNVSASCAVTVVERADGSGKTDKISSGTSKTKFSSSWYSSLFGPNGLFSSLTSKYTLPDHIPDYVVLTFDGSLNKNTDTILDALYLYDSFGTFFIQSKDIYRKDDRVRRIVGEGHTIGITLTSADLTNAGTALAALESANNKLSTVCGVPTRLVSIEGGSKDNLSKEIYKVLRKNGYRIWDWDYQVDETETSSKASEALEKELDTTGRIVIRMNTRKRTISTLEEVLGFMNYSSMSTQSLVDSDNPVCQMKKS